MSSWKKPFNLLLRRLWKFMAIVKMSKFSLFIMEEDKERLLEILQKFKYIHFVNLQDQQTFMPAATAETYGEETLTKLEEEIDRKSTRLNSSHVRISYAVFCLK